MNGTHQQGFGYRARRTFVRVFVFLSILLLGGAVVFLLSQLNARTFTLQLDNGQLVVMKGRNLPVGAVPFRPGDARLADAYAPLPLENQDASSLLLQRFNERDELDRALFPLLESLAKPRIQSDQPERVEQGVYYLRRAQKLSGLTEEQRLRLEQLLADVAFYQARQKLEDARKQIADALAQLQLAAESQNKNARSAHQMLGSVGPAARQLEEALRAAVHSQSAPREPAAPPPAPDAPRQPSGPTPAAPAPQEPPGAVQQPATEGAPVTPQVHSINEGEPQQRPAPADGAKVP
ncbi:IF-2 protein [Myxococcaceae bacterium GXIMD 01537]